MKVLSLFDGISCGMVALERAGIPVEEYCAFEIEESVIKISKKNYPQIKHYGNVLDAEFSQFVGFDMVIGGSPCQDLSITKSKSREGLKGSKSSLFWCFVAALEIVKPRYFLFENVASMKPADKDAITEALGVPPVMINSADFLPQNRERYYWTNIPIGDFLPRPHVFREVMQDKVEEKFYYNKPFTLDTDRTKNVIGEIELNTYEANRRVFNPDGVIGCLTCVSGGYQEKKVYDDKTNRVRKITPLEYERLQGLPDNYTAGVCNSKRYSAVGNGWTIPVIEHIFKGLKNGTS